MCYFTYFTLNIRLCSRLFQLENNHSDVIRLVLMPGILIIFFPLYFYRAKHLFHRSHTTLHSSQCSHCLSNRSKQTEKKQYLDFIWPCLNFNTPRRSRIFSFGFQFPSVLYNSVTFSLVLRISDVVRRIILVLLILFQQERHRSIFVLVFVLNHKTNSFCKFTFVH